MPRTNFMTRLRELGDRYDLLVYVQAGIDAKRLDNSLDNAVQLDMDRAQAEVNQEFEILEDQFAELYVISTLN